MKSLQHLVISAMLVATGLMSACALTGESVGESGSTYTVLVQSILDTRCTVCHSGPDPARGLALDSWEHLIEGAENGEAIIPFNAENSLLIELATRQVAGSHPAELDAEALNEAEIRAISEWIDAGAHGPDGRVPFESEREFVYVANQAEASIYVIDVITNVVARIVDLTALGFSSNSKPHHIVVEPDGSFWYVSLITENRVLKFNRENELVDRAVFEVPGMMAIDAPGDLLFVGRSMAAVNPPERIGIIQRSTMDIEEIPVFHPRPHAIALDPLGEFVYSASLAENRMIAVDLDSGDGVRETVDGPVHTLVQFAVAPDRSTLIVGGQLTGKLFFFDASAPPELPLLSVIETGAEPWHPVISADSRTAYIANKKANSVSVIDVQERKISYVIEGMGLSQPHGTALSTDGRYLYVSSNNLDSGYVPRYDLGENRNVGTLVVIDTGANKIVKVLEVGSYAAGVGSRSVK